MMNIRNYRVEFTNRYKLHWNELDTPAKRGAKMAHMRGRIWLTEMHEHFVRTMLTAR